MWNLFLYYGLKKLYIMLGRRPIVIIKYKQTAIDVKMFNKLILKLTLTILLKNTKIVLLWTFYLAITFYRICLVVVVGYGKRAKHNKTIMRQKKYYYYIKENNYVDFFSLLASANYQCLY